MKKNFYLLVIALLLALTHFIFITLIQFHLPHAFMTKPVQVEGVIDSIPVKKFHGYRFQLHVEKFDHHQVATEFLITWYQHAVSPKIGERWRLLVKLKPPIGSHNPDGFDYAEYLKSKGITATGYVITRTSHQLLGVEKYVIARFREHIQHEISGVIQDHAIAAFITALCVGLRDGLTQADWQIFQKTGTNHLVAIAGLHIGFVASIFYLFVSKLWRLSESTMLLIPATRAAAIGALCSAIAYTALSGFAIPAQRASIMLSFLLIATIVGLRISLFRRLFFAAGIIIILFPLDVMDASFWLSMMSIAVLAWVLSGRVQSQHSIQSHLAMQAAILIGLMPMMFFLFQQISLIAFFTNMIAIPWVGFIILPIAIAACVANLCHLFSCSHLLFFIAGKCLAPLWFFLRLASHFSYASYYHAVHSLLILIMGIIGMLFLLAPRGLPAKYIGCCGLLPLFFYHPPLPTIGSFYVTIIDVGQGLSVLVQTAHHVMLYDTGAHFPGGFDYGDSIVAPYLRWQSITTINRLEISHGDNDHSGGADAIVRDFHVQSIYTSAPKLIQHFHAQYCVAGQQWVWDGVHFTTFNPPQYFPYADNNSSCVIQISNGKTALLLTGDIQQEAEYRLVHQYGMQLKSIVLVVPHHGSKTSSSRLFLQTVMPEYAIISTGKYNRYHLPAQNIMSRYLKYHIKTYNTADSGAIIIRLLADGKVRLETDENPP